MPNANQLTRIRWHCRRGMLELDTLLNKYIEKHGEALDNQQLNDFERLLEYPDPILLEWLLSRNQSSDPKLQALVTAIKGKGK